MFNQTSPWGSMHRITIWGCLYIKPRREEGLWTSPQHVAVFLPFSSAEVCRLILSSAQEQPVLQLRDSSPGPAVGFDLFSQAGNQPPIWVWYSGKTSSSQAPLPWTGQVTLSPAPEPPKATLGKQESGRVAFSQSCTVPLEQHGASVPPLSPRPPGRADTPPAGLMQCDFKSAFDSKQPICYSVWQPSLSNHVIWC